MNYLIKKYINDELLNERFITQITLIKSEIEYQNRIFYFHYITK